MAMILQCYDACERKEDDARALLAQMTGEE
jgi:hypothetical protein